MLIGAAFMAAEADEPRSRRVVEAADEVRHRFGERAITRARLVGSRLPAPFERDPMTPVDRRSIGVDDRPVEPVPDGAAPRDDADEVDPEIEPAD